MSIGQEARPKVKFGEAFRYWVRLGFINFGGPAGQIAMMHRDLVDRNRWIAEGDFLRALNFCMLLPGPEAQQLATYIGWRLHGIRGGLMAGLWFILPSVFVLLALSWVVAAHGDVPLVTSLFYGIQPVVVAIVAEAVIRIGRRTLRHWVLFTMAAGAFVAIYAFRLPFPLIVLTAALLGLTLSRWWPRAFAPGESHNVREGNTPQLGASTGEYPKFVRTIKVLAICIGLWLVPVSALVLWRGFESVYFQEASFFTIAAFVTFGGAYAVLSFVAQAAVNDYGWLNPGEMVRGLALAESTPGPLIMVTQYVGFMGAWRYHGDLPPLVSGTIGALTVTYVTFLPSFMFIFAGAPYIEALAKSQRLQSALVGVTASVVGVILNLGVFFGTHVLLPSGHLDLFALALGVASFIVLSRLHWQVPVVVLLGAAIGVLWTVGRTTLGL